MSTLSLLFGVGLLMQAGTPAVAQSAAQSNVASIGNTPSAAVVVRTLTPVERGDIYMARKMYRDAIEMYMQAAPTAVVLNKIGIAYHQLAEIDTAGKYYQRAIKL